MDLTFATSITGIITAAGSLLTGAAVVMTAWRLLLPIKTTTRETHTLVNQAHTDLVNYQAALIGALLRAGIAVPDDQAHPGPDLPAREAPHGPAV